MDESATSDAAPRREISSSDEYRRRTTTPWAWLAIGVAASLGVMTFGDLRRASGNPESTSHGSEVPRATRGRVVYDQAFAERASIVMEAVSSRDVVPYIDVVGTVTFDPQRVAAVGTRVRGRVIDVSVVEGDAVAQWDVLARLESAELGGAHQRVHAPGDKTAKKRLGRFALRSPIDGEIVGVHVRDGESVEPRHTAFRVADLSEVWVELAVFERDRGHVAVGDTVQLEPLGSGGPPVPGVVAHVGRVLDRATRTFAVRVVVDNAQRRFAIGQAVQARLHAKRPAQTAPAVPREAVSLVGGRATRRVEADAVEAR